MKKERRLNDDSHHVFHRIKSKLCQFFLFMIIQLTPANGAHNIRDLEARTLPNGK